MAFAGWLRRAPKPDRAEVAALKDGLRAHLALGAEDEITVSEIACPACGPDAVETVALVMRRGEGTVALKSPHPLHDLASRPDLLATFGRDEALHGR